MSASQAAISTELFVPEELRSRRQWLIWKFLRKSGKQKPSKIPYYASTGNLRGWPNGKPKDGIATDEFPQVEQGHPLDRENLVTFDEAQEAAEAAGMDGIGFAFLPGDGLIGIDLDACIETDDDVRRERAAKILKSCNSFAEYSPSGNGMHIIVAGETETFKSNALGIEVFCGRQFFTYTGNIIQGAPITVNPIDLAVLEKLRKTVKKDRERSSQDVAALPSPPATADKIIEALRFISPDVGYEEWLRLGMAIHAELGANGIAVWDEWSRGGGKYPGLAEITSHWKSFKGSGVTGGTLFRMAMDAGWKPPHNSRQREHFERLARERWQGNDHDHPPIYDEDPAPEIHGGLEPANDNDNDLPAGEQSDALPVEPAQFDMHTIDWWSPFPDISGTGNKPLSTIENLAEACRRLNVTVRYNVISKEIEILIPGHGFSIDNKANASLAWLMSACARFRMPTGQIGEFLCYMADANPYNPVAEWIKSRPWDGQSRLHELLSTIRAAGEEDDLRISFIKEAMLKRWMLSAVAAAFEPNGVSAHGVLVLQGDQYLGKTAWFKSLVPAHLGVIQDGLMLRPDDRDSIKQAVSYWMVELGELDATFRKSDIAQLKAFITRDRDVIRRAYARLESHYARRTVFFASVNPRQFLHDPTGNRRYWTISCAAINYDHRIDMQQVWAEIYTTLYLSGERWYLTKDEMAALNEHNKDFEVLDPVRERLQSRYDWAAPEMQWRWITATEVMLEIGFDKPNRADVTQCGQIVQELNGGRFKKSNGRKLSLVPPKIYT